MNKSLKTFIESFRIFDMDFLAVLIYDLLAYAIIIPTFFLYFWLLNRQAENLNIPGDLNTFLMSASQEQIASIAGNLRFFVISLIAGIVIVSLVALFAFTLSRMLVWSHLAKKKFSIKKFFKLAALFIILLVFSVIFLLLLNLVAVPLSSFSYYISFILYNLLLILLIYFIYLAKFEFAKIDKLFESLGKTFAKFKEARTWISYLFALVVFIILSVMLNFTNRLSLINPWLIIVSFALIFIYLNWLRLYIFEVHK